MKLFIILFLALFSTAFSSFGFLPQEQFLDTTQDLEDHRPIDNLRYFFLTLYKEFNLTEPDQIVTCFNDKSATLFFKSLYEFHQLLNDTKERNQWRLHFDYAKIALLFHSLESVRECVQSTQDYRDLLEVLGLEDYDEKELDLGRYIYYQARYASLLNDFIPVIKNLNQKDNRGAGLAYARVISNVNETFHYRGFYFLAHQAFENGFNIKLGLKNPSDSLRCWNNDSAHYYLEFFEKMAEVISNGTWRESRINLHYFWRDYGQDLMKKIPSEVFDCLENSYDGQQILHSLGLNIFDGSFLEPFMSYVSNNRFEFYWTMRSMKHNFDYYNLNHVGGIWARLLQKVARRQPNEPQEELEEVLY